MRRNVQLKDGGNSLNVVTYSDNVKFGNVVTSSRNGNILDGTNLNGVSLSDYINGVYGKNDQITFMHISDDHSRYEAMNAMIALANEDSSVDFVVDTGDFVSAWDDYAASECRVPKLAVWGNHDTYDKFHNDPVAAAAAIREIMGDAVSYGAEDASYWYKDFTTERGSVVRVIGFDEYEFANTDVVMYSVWYKQAQIDWFINLLKSTPSSYYIILAHHQSVVKYPSDNYSDFKSIYANSHQSAGLNVGGEDDELLAKIIDAYQNRRVFTFSSTRLSINEDFSLIQPATFLMHIGGHYHSDVCEYLVGYPSQLQLLVSKSVNDTQVGDLTYSDFNYCVNRVTVDFYMRQIRLQRIGAQEKVDDTYRIKIDYYNRKAF